MRVISHFYLPFVVVLSFSLGFLFHYAIDKDWSSLRLAEATHRRSDTTTSVATDGGTSSVVAANDKQINRAPLFVLHVGPKETGGSAIQWYSARYKSILEQDNFYYLGNWREQPPSRLQGLYKQCFMAKSELAEIECKRKWDDLRRDVDLHFAQNHNVFVSEDMLSAFHDENDADEHLWNFLVPMLKKWRVRVIFSYRRYYEWLPSKYFQLYNPQKGGKRERWVDEGGRVTPTFASYMTFFVSDKEHKTPPVIKARWEKHFPSNVAVFNTHETDDIVSGFFCKMMPEAPTTCAHASTSRGEATDFYRPLLPNRIHYDMLALEAYERGWIKKGMSRSVAIDAIETFSGEELGLFNLTDFRMTCLSPKERKMLLDASSALEVEMTSTESTELSSGKSKIKADFGVAVKNGAFCSVDVDKEFQRDGRWRRFFQRFNSDIELSFPDLDDIKFDNNAKIESASKSPTGPSKLLCLYVGDEGSTVLSESLRQHPHVYSPAWKIEPVNPRNWDEEDFSLEKQMDAIRFLLRLPSQITKFQTKRGSYINEAELTKKVGNARATYLKARVCKNMQNKTRTWTECMTDVIDGLVCGKPEDTIDHLILPVRYGFDRICSKFVHQHKSLYQQLSQFHGDNSAKTKNFTMTFSKNEAERLVVEQEDYLQDFLENIRVAQSRCPNQSKKAQIHIFDYDRAKRIGLETALTELFSNIGLRHNEGDLRLGDLAGRKPSNYCEKLFDADSQIVIQNAERAYNQWLRNSCEGGRHYPWCNTLDYNGA